MAEQDQEDFGFSLPRAEQTASNFEPLFEALRSPANSAALLQFGLNAMQPLSIGQNQLGHIAQSVGAGAEAAARSRVLEEAGAKAKQDRQLAERKADREDVAAEGHEEERGFRQKLMAQREKRMGAESQFRQRADSAPIGAIVTQGGVRYKKTGPNKWDPIDDAAAPSTPAPGDE